MNKKSLVLQDFLFFITTFLIFIISISLVLTYSRKESDDNLVRYSEIVLALYDEGNNNYSEVDKALVILFNETNYQELYQYNRNFLRWSSIICLVVSSSIFYLILPLIIRGQTLGRLIMKTEIVSQDDSKASIPQLIVRYIAFFMIVVLMSLWLYFIPLGVNLLVYFIDKKRRSLPDFFAVTYTREKYQETEKIIENKEGSQI